MSIVAKSFTSVNDLTGKDIQTLFERAKVFQKLSSENKSFKSAYSLNGDREHNALLFFAEPSTRTRMSFEISCNHLGIHPILFSDINSSSIVKGESLEETLRTLKALKPSVIILRYKGTAFKFEDSIPVINAGFGSYEHPTQALIDAFTVEDTLNSSIKGKKMLILGDILHSRVSNSNLKLFRMLGGEVAFCSPTSLFPTDPLWKDVKCFQDLNSALEWADVIMCLRIQQERHDMSIGLSIAEYRDKYHLGVEQLQLIKPEALILHPGPCIFGVEMSREVFYDKRSAIMKQVSNGLFIRSAVLSLILDFKWTANC